MSTDDKAAWQVQTAFYLSLVTASFSVFQWWTANRENQIAASIAVATKHIDDERMYQARMIAGSLYILGSKKALSEPDVDTFNRLRENAVYAATLLSEGRVREEYLGDTMLCDIWLVNTVTKIRSPGSIGDAPGSAIAQVAPRLQQRCENYYGR